MLNSSRLGLNFLSAVLHCVMLNVRSRNARASEALGWSITDSAGAPTAEPQDGSENPAWSEQRLAPRAAAETRPGRFGRALSPASDQDTGAEPAGQRAVKGSSGPATVI